MEIKEIVNYFLNSEKNILEVTFRTIEDTEDNIRMDSIDYELVTEYGYELESESFLFFDEEDGEDEFTDDEKIELDEEELMSFLNEYYTVNPNSIPKSTPY
jgi:hypothetical protein